MLRFLQSWHVSKQNPWTQTWSVPNRTLLIISNTNMHTEHRYLVKTIIIWEYWHFEVYERHQYGHFIRCMKSRLQVLRHISNGVFAWNLYWSRPLPFSIICSVMMIIITFNDIQYNYTHFVAYNQLLTFI